MSEILRKFKSVFIVEDEGASTSNPAGSTQHPAEMTARPGKVQHKTAEATAVPPSPVSGALNEKFVQALANALEKNNQEGFDYFEFRQALINLSKMPMDEQTRFQSAFALAQTMGANTTKLVDSARYYLDVLNNEQTHFAEAHAQQKAKLVGDRGKEVQNLEASMQQKAEQIKKLTEEIEHCRKQSEKIRQEISESTVKIEATKADFETTFSSVVGQIQDDLSKIQQYLK